MALVGMREVLQAAEKSGYGVGSFNVFNVETLEGVVAAATELQSPVVAAVYEGHLNHLDLETYADMVQRVAARAPVPIILHLDHSQSLAGIVRALRCGFTSVMFDGYNLDYEEKVQQTAEVVKVAHAVGVDVEVELGHIARGGDDPRVQAEAKRLQTDPRTAEDFVARTGVDILAVAIGSIHGMVSAQASLDLDLLQSIRRRVPCFLSLHGGSGCKKDEIQRAIKLGISKLSIYTRMTVAAKERLQRTLASGDEHLDLIDVMHGVREGFKEVVMERMDAFGSTGVCRSANALCASCASSGCARKQGQAADGNGHAASAGDDELARLISKITAEVLGRQRRE